MNQKQDVPIPTILDGLHNSIVACAHGEQALADLLGDMVGRNNGAAGNDIPASIIVPGRQPKPPTGPNDRQILAHIAQSLRMIMQAQRLTMLAVGTMLDNQKPEK